jgi:trk system potassium uptake protein
LNGGFMTSTRKFLVVGLGRFGNAVAETIWNRGGDLTVVDRDPRLVDEIKGRTHAAFVGDGTDPQVLESVGAASVDTAVVTFGESFESAVLATAALKSLNVLEIVARASTSRRADVLRAVGATRVLEIEHEMGVRAAEELLTPSARDLLDLAAQYRVVPWPATGALVGRTLKESGLRQKYEINIIGLRSVGDKQTKKLIFPAPDYVIKEGDICLLVAEESNMQRFIANQT